MEKRFVVLMLVLVAAYLANALVVNWLWPRPKVALNVPAAAAKDAAEKKDGAGKKDNAGKKDDAAPKDAPQSEAKDADSPKDDAPPPDAAKPADKVDADKVNVDKADANKLAETAAPEAWASLGSADPAENYRMLVLITTHGAAIERIELNSPRYRALDHRGGYLGPLEAIDSLKPPGAVARVVGYGTPAAKGGMLAGDVIETFDGAPIGSAADLAKALDEHRPGDNVKLKVSRDGAKTDLSATLGHKPLEVVRPEYKQEEVESIDGKHDPLSMLFTLERVGTKKLSDAKEELPGVDLRQGNWRIAASNQTEVTLERTLPRWNLKVKKTYTLAKVTDLADSNDPAYHLLVRIEIENLSDAEQTVAYRLEGPTGLPIEGAWYAQKVNRSSGNDLRVIVVRSPAKDPVEYGCTLLSDETNAKPVEPWLDPALDFCACDSQYFVAALIPRPKVPGENWESLFQPLRVGDVLSDPAKKRLTNVSFMLTSKPRDLAAGESLSQEYQLFAGPKKPDLLDEYIPKEPPNVKEASLSDLIYYGWFGFVARPMLAILHAFYAVIRNYGIAILMLTIMVRGAMFPLSRRQALSAQKMQDLQPEIKRLNEKFKKNPQEKNRAVQELFRKNNCNPVGGCFVALIQAPIFIGLYRSLSVDVELRQAPLLGSAIHWCSNLASPDMFWNWSAWMPAVVNNGTGSIFGLGPYLNILPLVTVVIILIQQKLFMPKAMDEQAAMQQKMMQFMMIFMGVMFFKIASGICLYSIASSSWSICERKLLLPKTMPPKTPQVAVAKRK